MSLVNGEPAGHHAAAEHALRVLKALAFGVALRTIELTDVQERGSLFRFRAGQNSIHQSLRAARRGIERDHFH